MQNKLFYIVVGIVLLISVAVAYVISEDGNSTTTPTQVDKSVPPNNMEFKL